MIVIAHALYVNNCAYDAVFYKKQCGVNREKWGFVLRLWILRK